jgi:hypothetical protein
VPSIGNSTYHPEFGRSLNNKKLTIELVQGQSELVLSW